MKPSNDSFGGNSFNSTSNSFDIPDGFMAMNSNNQKKSNTNVSYDAKESSNVFENSEMFNEKDFASIKGNDSEFMTSEMNILQQELGADFFFGGSGENISGDSILASSDEDLPSYGVDEEYASNNSNDSAEMQVSYGNLESGSEPEIEMMRFDSSSLDDENDESISMMRYDSDVFSLDELKEE